MILESISTNDNAADQFTKSLGRQLFHHHLDTIIGRRIPADLLQSNPTGTIKTCMKTQNETLQISKLTFSSMSGVRYVPSLSIDKKYLEHWQL
jgi:hypothetical protein